MNYLEKIKKIFLFFCIVVFLGRRKEETELFERGFVDGWGRKGHYKTVWSWAEKREMEWGMRRGL